MKKLAIILVLMITTLSCSLIFGEEWDEYKEDRKERGVSCYRYPSGNIYCKDKYGNPA